MFLEIYTKTIIADDLVYFAHRYFIDGVEVETKKYQFDYADLSDTKSYQEMLTNKEWLGYFFNACNIGRAIHAINEQDRKSGVKKKHSHLTEHLRVKRNLPKTWIEYNSGEKRYAVVYTDCVETYRNINVWCAIPNHYLIRCFDRLLRLSKNYFIDIRLRNDKNNFIYEN